MSEKSPGDKEQEKLTHERVVALLKEDPNNLTPYLAYRSELEAQLPKNSIGGLQLIIKMATICLDAAILQASNDEGIDPKAKEELLASLYVLIDRVPPLS